MQLCIDIPPVLVWAARIAPPVSSRSRRARLARVGRHQLQHYSSLSALPGRQAQSDGDAVGVYSTADAKQGSKARQLKYVRLQYFVYSTYIHTCTYTYYYRGARQQEWEAKGKQGSPCAICLLLALRRPRPSSSPHRCFFFFFCKAISARTPKSLGNGPTKQTENLERQEKKTSNAWVDEKAN